MIKTQILRTPTQNGNMAIVVDEGYSYSFMTVVDRLGNVIENDIVSFLNLNIY